MKAYFLAKRHVEVYSSCNACGESANRRRKMARLLIRRDDAIIASIQLCRPCLLQGAEMSISLAQ